MTGITASSLLQMRAQILQQNSALQRAAATGPAMPQVGGAGAAAPGATPPGGGDAVSGFGSALKTALTQVNAMQSRSEDVSASYERGDTTDIASVMLAREQASIGFQATLQVRNKILSAYKDIMSMPV